MNRPNPARCARILIADGRADDRQRLQLVLEALGHAVVATTTAGDAWSAAHRQTPDLILSETVLAGGDGFELCRRLQQDPTLRHVPFLFITSDYEAPQDRELAHDVGAVRVLPKSLSAGDLKAIVNSALRAGYVPDATQRLRRLDEGSFHQRHAAAAVAELQKKIGELEQLNRRYRLLSDTNHAIVRIQDRLQLLTSICRTAVRSGGALAASITLVHGTALASAPAAVWPDLGSVRAATRGVQRAALSVFACCDEAIQSRAITIHCPDLAPSSSTSAGARSHPTVGCVAAIPILEADGVAGVLQVFAADPAFFTEEMRQTFEEIAADVSFGLATIARSAERDAAAKAATEALAYSRLLISSSPVGIITYKASGAAMTANEAAAMFVGGSVGDLLRMNFREIESWKSSGLLELAEQCLASNQVVERDVHIAPTSFGKDAWCVCRLVPFEYNSERYLLAQFSDITDRTHAEQALRISEERFRSAMHNSAIGVALVGVDGKWLEVNDAVSDLLGYSREELLQMDFQTVTHPDDLAADLEQVQSLLQGRIQKFQMEKRYAHKSGRIVWAILSVALVRHANGDPAYFISQIQDITERKRAQRALEESEGKYRALVEQQSLVGIFMIDADRVLYQNPRADEIFGYAPGEAVGRALRSLVAEDDWPMVEKEIRRLVSAETSVAKVDFRGLQENGHEVLINAQAVRAHSEGRPILIGVIQDVTEQRRAEESIQRHVAELERAFMHTVDVATTLSEMRDPYTAGHERRVAEIAVAIAAELGFDARRQQGMRIAGFLHDVGKITIPAEILSKPGRLNEVEIALVRQHAKSSYDILKNVEFPWPVAQVAYQHHERMDGSGYPRGLSGDAILLESRVLAVADVVEATASHRPYRPGRGLQPALAEIERGRGTAYDANVVDACLRLFRQNGFELPDL